MDLSASGRARIAAGALLLTLIPLLPSASAQLPIPLEEEGIHIALLCTDGFIEPDYAGQDSAVCMVQDFSRDSLSTTPGSATGPSFHPVALTTVPRPGFENVEGWQVLVSEPNFALRGGESRRVEVRVIATPGITLDQYEFDLVANYRVGTGYNNSTAVPLVAQVNPYGFAITSWVTSSARKAGQDEVVVYELAVTNSGVYPDTYSFDVTIDKAFQVTEPANIYVGPGETRSVNISVLTPKGKLYDLGTSAPMIVKVTSMGVGDIPGNGAYSASATLQVRGFHVPIYWIPLTLVGLVSMGVVIRAGSEKASLRSEERGSPRPVSITPRQAVLLQELKRSDRETYKEKKASLDVVYKERVSDYRSHRKEREAADREEAKQAAIEFAAQKKARKAQRIEEKRARIEAKRAAKVEAREMKKREKQLAKARAKLEKAQKKQAKIDAKLAAKQAKLDAKQAAKDAKTAKAAAKVAAAQAKAQAKADKAAAKAAKKRQDEPPPQ